VSTKMVEVGVERRSSSWDKRAEAFGSNAVPFLQLRFSVLY
jgi:hypothetical protein